MDPGVIEPAVAGFAHLTDPRRLGAGGDHGDPGAGRASGTRRTSCCTTLPGGRPLEDEVGPTGSMNPDRSLVLVGAVIAMVGPPDGRRP